MEENVNEQTNQDVEELDQTETETEPDIAEEEEQQEESVLEALRTAFPEAQSFESLDDIPNYARYAELLSSGLTCEEAYAAANYTSIGKHAAKGLAGTKDHLRSNVPKGARAASSSMTRRELLEWRDLFPNKSDKEIAELYRRVN